jgi:cation transport regulator ChaB
MLINLLKKLPEPARKIYDATYRNIRAKGGSVESATRIAISAVKNKYKKSDDKWIVKNILTKLNLVKTGFLFPEYSMDIVISNTLEDKDGQRVSPELLKKLSDNDQIDNILDIDHERYCAEKDILQDRSKLTSDLETKGLYTLKAHYIQNNELIGQINLNKNHRLYKKYLALNKKGEYLKASAEFQNAKVEDGIIIDAEKMRVSLTNYPSGNGTVAKKVYIN